MFHTCMNNHLCAYTYTAATFTGGFDFRTSVTVEATSEPEADYEAKKKIEKWLERNRLMARDLSEFRLKGVRRAS